MATSSKMLCWASWCVDMMGSCAKNKGRRKVIVALCPIALIFLCYFPSCYGNILQYKPELLKVQCINIKAHVNAWHL